MLKNRILIITTVSIMASSMFAVWGDKPEFGALVVGRTVNRAWIVGDCTDKGTKDQAIKCAQKKFKKNGGVIETGIRDWKCKGWMAAATSSKGGFGIAWCRESEAKAKADATAVCLKSNADCVPIFAKDDTN